MMMLFICKWNTIISRVRRMIWFGWIIIILHYCCALSLALSTKGQPSSSSSGVPGSCKGICQYSQSFWDGNVCIGCFRDTYEIQNWPFMTADEKSIALEDATERQNYDGNEDEVPSSSASFLSSDEIILTMDQYQESSTIVKSSQLYNTHNDYDEKQDSSDTLKQKEKYIKLDDDNQINLIMRNDGIIPPTPCTRICRYNSDFYDGLVCIGCFRDSYDIRHWSHLSEIEKSYALDDAVDRCKQSSLLSFKGGISEKELIRQANQWRNSIKPSTTTDSEINNHRWNEINIMTNEIKKYTSTHNDNSGNNPSSDYNDFLIGNSVITFDSPVLTSSERCHIMNTAREIADRHRTSRIVNGLSDEGIVRIPTIEAAKRARAAKNQNTPHATAISDDETNKKLQNLFARVCHILDRHHKPMIESLFGNKDKMSLLQLFQSDLLSFSSREPAINVYTKHGEFRPHTDGQKLTMLIPLSSKHEYSSQGTAFWSPESRGPRIDPPSTTIRPDCGGVPILFVGHVLHSGLPIKHGERIVYVASFSLKLN